MGRDKASCELPNTDFEVFVATRGDKSSQTSVGCTH